MGSQDEVKFTVTRAQLADAVAFARAGLGSGKGLAEQLFRFDIGAGSATVTASDGDLIATADFLIEKGTAKPDDVSFAVLGKKMVDLLGRVRDAETFEIQVDTENAEFQIQRKKSAPSVINFERLDHDLLQFAVHAIEKARQVMGPAEVEIPRGVLLEALEVASSSTMKNSGNVAVDHVELRQGCFYASDGRRITCVKSAGFHSAARLKAAVSVLGRLMTALKTLPKDRALIPCEGDAHYFGVAPNRFLAIRKVAHDFPAVEQMFEEVQKGQVVLDRGEFQQALGEVGLGLPSGKTEIEILLETGGLTMVAENSVGRKSRRTIAMDSAEADSKGESFPIGIDHLTASLGSMKGKSVNLYVFSKTEAVLLQDVNDTREILAILPFRRKAEAVKPVTPGAEGTEQAPPPPERTVDLGDEGGEIIL